MTVSIFYVTFRRDFDFHIYSMRSIAKYSTGFHEVVLCVPNPDVEMFQKLEPLLQGKLTLRVIGYDEIPGKGMVQHEAIIMQAEKYCTGEAILHMDSDVLFWEAACPDDYFVNGKPVCYREEFELFRNYGGRYAWKEAVFRATGIDAKYETMVRHPMIYPRWLYPVARQYVKRHTKMECYDYFCAGKNDWPQSVAEHPTLGAVAIEHNPDAFHWVDFHTNTADFGYQYQHGRDKVIAFWSHGGTERYIKQLEEICPSTIRV